MDFRAPQISQLLNPKTFSKPFHFLGHHHHQDHHHDDGDDGNVMFALWQMASMSPPPSHTLPITTNVTATTTTIIFIIIIWWSGHIRYWEGRLFILLPSNTHLDYMSADHTSHLSKTTFVEKISVMWTVTNFKIECKSHNFSGGENCNFCGKKMYNLVDKLNIFCEETFSLIFYL